MITNSIARSVVGKDSIRNNDSMDSYCCSLKYRLMMFSRKRTEKIPFESTDFHDDSEYTHRKKRHFLCVQHICFPNQHFVPMKKLFQRQNSVDVFLLGPKCFDCFFLPILSLCFSLFLQHRFSESRSRSRRCVLARNESFSFFVSLSLSVCHMLVYFQVAFPVRNYRKFSTTPILLHQNFNHPLEPAVSREQQSLVSATDYRQLVFTQDISMEI